MDSAKPPRDRRRFYLLAFLLVAVAVVLAVGAAVFVTMGPALLNLPRINELDAAIKLRKHDTEAGAALAEKVLADARAANVPRQLLIALYRQYAEALYADNEIADGDAAEEKGVALCPSDPPANSIEADHLSHLYQDKGGAHYNEYTHDRSLDSGAKDQEKSLAVAEKAFGPDHEQTIYKAPTLALIYADTGRTADAEKIMQRCLTSISTKDSSRQCAWFVYTILSRMRGIQHRYPEAVKAYVEACKNSTDETQKDRAWSEFADGLKLSQPAQGEDWKKSAALLKKSKFDELEKMLTACLASRESEGMGEWVLDDYYWGLHGGYTNSREQDFAQQSTDLKRWIAHNPHSIFARTALAHACLYSFWGMRGGSAPSKERGRLMNDRLKVAREMLNADPDTKKKNPSAYSAEVRLLLAEGADKQAVLKVADECHKAFPNYVEVDFWTVKFVSGRWLGTDEEADQYIKARADKLGATKGDEAFTQIYHYEADPQKNILELPAMNSPGWSRMKAGYKGIFKDHPNDMDARLQAVSDAVRNGDDDFIAHVFDDKGK